MSEQPSPHHHGNLKPALVKAGIDILEREGLAGLSLRKIATAVGVSHAAPAHHFKGKTGLLVAIAAEGFTLFSQYMRDGRAAASSDPHDQLLGLCLGYLRFARNHAALFELIFSTEIKDHADAHLQETSSASFALLQETCALFEPSPKHALANEVMIWSLVHGYATLRVYNKLTPPDGDTEMPFELILPPMMPKPTSPH